MKSERVRGWLVHHKVNSLGSLSCPRLPSYFVKNGYSQFLCGSVVHMSFQYIFFCRTFFQLSQVPYFFMPTAFTILVCSPIFHTSYCIRFLFFPPVFAHHLNNDIITQPLTCFPTSLYCRLHDPASCTVFFPDHIRPVLIYSHLPLVTWTLVTLALLMQHKNCPNWGS